MAWKKYPTLLNSLALPYDLQPFGLPFTPRLPIVVPRGGCLRWFESHILGGAGAVNFDRLSSPSAASIELIVFSASSNPSLPNILCSMSSN